MSVSFSSSLGRTCSGSPDLTIPFSPKARIRSASSQAMMLFSFIVFSNSSSCSGSASSVKFSRALSNSSSVITSFFIPDSDAEHAPDSSSLILSNYHNPDTAAQVTLAELKFGGWKLVRRGKERRGSGRRRMGRKGFECMGR